MDQKKQVIQAAKAVKEAAIYSGGMLGGAMIAGAGGLIAGYLIVSNRKHLSSGFQAALKKWRRESGHSLTLKAKLLRFRNAVSYGFATAKEKRRQISHKHSLLSNPYYKESYEKACKEGRKMKLSEKLKAKIKFYSSAIYVSLNDSFAPSSYELLSKNIKKSNKNASHSAAKENSAANTVTARDMQKLSTAQLIQKIKGRSY